MDFVIDGLTVKSYEPIYFNNSTVNNRWTRDDSLNEISRQKKFVDISQTIATVVSDRDEYLIG